MRQLCRLKLWQVTLTRYILSQIDKLWEWNKITGSWLHRQAATTHEKTWGKVGSNLKIPLSFCWVNVCIHNSCPSNHHSGQEGAWGDKLLLSPPHLHPWLGGSSNTVIIYLLCTRSILCNVIFMPLYGRDYRSS